MNAPDLFIRTRWAATLATALFALSGCGGSSLAGGLGGFVLPIMFGALVDLTGVRSSCFMLMYGVVWVSLTWMYFSEIRKQPLLGKAAAQPLQGESA